jgi:DNA-directed RNA polymerase specialized sigma24 family protein
VPLRIDWRLSEDCREAPRLATPAALPNDEASQKPELLLSRAGFTAREIAEILGKNQAAVAKAIERAKKASRTIPSGPAGTPQSENAVLYVKVVTMMAKSASATLDDLLKQAKTTNRLLAAQLKSQMSQQELVKLLKGTDLTNQELAEVLDTTAATVAVTLQRLKKKAAGKGKEASLVEGSGSESEADPNG